MSGTALAAVFSWSHVPTKTTAANHRKKILPDATQSTADENPTVVARVWDEDQKNLSRMENNEIKSIFAHIIPERINRPKMILCSINIIRILLNPFI